MGVSRKSCQVVDSLLNALEQLRSKEFIAVAATKVISSCIADYR
jgi:hypothetical protein